MDTETGMFTFEYTVAGLMTCPECEAVYVMGPDGDLTECPKCASPDEEFEEQFRGDTELDNEFRLDEWLDYMAATGETVCQEEIRQLVLAGADTFTYHGRMHRVCRFGDGCYDVLDSETDVVVQQGVVVECGVCHDKTILSLEEYNKLNNRHGEIRCPECMV